MQMVIHRVNSIVDLKKISTQYGCEIDIRTDGSHLILNHEPFDSGDLLTDYLDNYQNGLLVLNIKEAGIEKYVLEEVRKRNISEYFLLDVEFPYIYRASRLGERSIAVRYSEDEPLELVARYKDRIDWVWIDTNSILPLDNSVLKVIDGMKTCLVCPERWGRAEDIITYRTKMKQLQFEPTAVMTGLNYVTKWQTPLPL